MTTHEEIHKDNILLFQTSIVCNWRTHKRDDLGPTGQTPLKIRGSPRWHPYFKVSGANYSFMPSHDCIAVVSPLV